MKHLRWILLWMPLACGAAGIIPKPVSEVSTHETFTWKKKTIIYINSDSLIKEAEFLAAWVHRRYGISAQVRSGKPSGNAVFLKLVTDKEMGEEGYRFDVGTKQICIAGKPAGVFYGIQSLIQLMQPSGRNIMVGGTHILDRPVFKWRGMHLDVVRHFFPVDFVCRYIDLLSYYKMNVFHWHLTDDQGWRIEIRKYPALQRISAWRNGTMVGPYSNQQFDSIKYGGYYTQEEIRKVVAYAAERHITVVPEIEMPGHALAALTAYPEYSCTCGPFEVARGWGVFQDVFCPRDETFQFLEDILSEVMALFPSPFIHIGGDECPKDMWRTCVHCQYRIYAMGLKDEHELQGYFIKRIEKFVNQHQRQIIGWDEILEGGLAPNAAVMSWRGTEGGKAAARMHHPVVMTPGSHCYFDHYQSKDSGEPLAIGGYTPLEKVYQFNPIPDSLSKEEQQYILGAQANIWTEYILNEAHVEYMMMPRMLALSEVLWGTSDKENYADFLNRLNQQVDLFKYLKINFAPHAFSKSP